MLQIDKITAADRTQYLDFSHQFFSGDAALFAPSDEQIGRTFDAALSGSPLLDAFILRMDGVPAGYLQLSYTYSNEAGGPVVLIEELFVAEAFRSHGIGSQVFAWLRETHPDCRRFRLEVCERNPRAKALYERLGFKVLPYIQMVLEE